MAAFRYSADKRRGTIQTAQPLTATTLIEAAKLALRCNQQLAQLHAQQL
jgi:hypothetical protein